MAGPLGQAFANRWLDIDEALKNDTLNPFSRKGQPTEIPKLGINAPPPVPAPLPAPAPRPAPGPAPGPVAGAI